MTYDFTPKGVCSQHMRIELEDGIIAGVQILGGCNGNLQGISRLVKGLRVEDAIEKMKGIRCKEKPTSCPDQLAQALTLAMAQGK